jgi:hypothetical protein
MKPTVTKKAPAPAVAKFPALAPTNVLPDPEEQQARIKGLLPMLITPTLELVV